MNAMVSYEIVQKGTFERPRFFPGQLITHEELTLGLRYAQDQMRLHNRLLHGWGVVCGCAVRACAPDEKHGWHVKIERGYVLDALGNMIHINCDVKLDLRAEELIGCAVGPDGEVSDPWCSDIKVDRQVNQTLYIAVRYAEFEGRPVRTQPNGCGCDDSDCEYSRIYDSFVIRPLTRLPKNYSDPMESVLPEDVLTCDHMAERPCPPYPTDPWVILADVTVAADGRVLISYNHRRIVLSLADTYLICDVPDKNEANLDERVKRMKRVAFAALEEATDPSELERFLEDPGNDISRIVDLPSVTLRNVGPGSELGARLIERNMTIRDLAAVEDVDALVTDMTKNVSAAKAADIRRRLPEIHRRAQNVIEIVKVLERT